MQKALVCKDFENPKPKLKIYLYFIPAYMQTSMSL